MVKEIDRAGIPITHITNLTPIARVTGSNRIVPGIALTNPCSDVSLPYEEQKKMQKKYVERALLGISTDIEEQTLF
jgi:glycine reductase